MINILILIFASCFVTDVPYTDLPASDADMNLDVTISGIKKTTGEIRIAIYSKKNEFPSEKDIYDFRIVPVKGSEVTCTFVVKEKGEYAMALIHDVNSSGNLEYNWVGYPLEPFGFSNNPRVIFKAPTFEECAVNVEKNTKIEIRL
jgi:uncharacterized protein (DUF2141 family)